ncbi:MAG: PAS-domain containing protein [Paracoccaceae bacterium]|nr:PAS-domain containing protein [Paracoccaceae bacterium]
MVLSSTVLATLLAASSVAAALLALAAAARFGPQGRLGRRATHRPSANDGIVFLFDQAELVDATRAGERLIAAAPTGGTDWTRLLSLLTPEFPDLAGRVDSLAAEGVQVFTSQDTATQLTAEWRDGLRRLTIVDEDIAAAPARIDAHNLAALERELEILRANTDLAPAPVWRQKREGGEITWFNRVYLEELRRLRGPDAAERWPIAPIFDAEAVSEAARKKSPLRAAAGKQDQESWYDVHVRDDGDELVCAAVNVDRLVGTERQLRGFMQTLTKTFADLDAGLAIFDRSRRLVMFNPALGDLTGLPPGFLAAHPTLFGVLDRMRDLGRVPEPRNYTEWRKRMTELESDAADGFFAETWALPSGETLRVTGRPHPDGAIAFIFEDISAEIRLTRRFRSELEVSQAVIDTLEDGVAVFSAAGVLALSNRAYAELWGEDPMARLDHATLADILQIWAARTAPTALWVDVETYLRNAAGRAPWTTEAMLLDGRGVSCQFSPLPGGATMVRFSPSATLAGDVRFRRRA